LLDNDFSAINSISFSQEADLFGQERQFIQSLELQFLDAHILVLVGLRDEQVLIVVCWSVDASRWNVSCIILFFFCIF